MENVLFVNLLVEYIAFLDKKAVKIAVIDLPDEVKNDFQIKLRQFNIDGKLYRIENESIPNSLSNRVKENNLDLEVGKVICTW
jgi:hypothetical protein